MVSKLYKILFSVFFLNIFISCTASSDVDQTADVAIDSVASYTYTECELETMRLINEYRSSIGLNSLERIDYISVKAEEHNEYMISKNIISHDNFVNRSEEIIKTLKATSVNENVAYNYKSAAGVVNAWLESSEHKKNIEGNFEYFGVSIRKDSIKGTIYYTNIFVKL